MQRSALCRSRRELSNAYFLAKFGFDTAENEPCQLRVLLRDSGGGCYRVGHRTGHPALLLAERARPSWPQTRGAKTNNLRLHFTWSENQAKASTKCDSSLIWAMRKAIFQLNWYFGNKKIVSDITARRFSRSWHDFKKNAKKHAHSIISFRKASDLQVSKTV